jgi:hypothetical protein
MANGVPKNEFDASTRVMESGLLRALTEESSDVADHTATAPSREAAPQIEVVVAHPVEPGVATTSAASTTETGQAEAAPELPGRRFRLFIVAGIVAAIVLAFDASLFVFHPHRQMRPPIVAATAQEPLPRYMLLPPDAPQPPAAVARNESSPVQTAPVTIPNDTAAVPDTPILAVHSHRHSHHRHANH